MRRPQPWLLEVDGGYVLVCGLRTGIASAQRLSRKCRGQHVTLVLQAPDSRSAALEAFAVKAAEICTRIVIYEPDVPGRGNAGERAALFARAVRSSARTECGVILDDSRALRHCIDGMAAGGIIVYCCDDPANAVDILDEYGAKAVTDVGSRRRRQPAAAGPTPSAPVKAAGIALPRRLGGM